MLQVGLFLQLQANVGSVKCCLHYVHIHATSHVHCSETH